MGARIRVKGARAPILPEDGSPDYNWLSRQITPQRADGAGAGDMRREGVSISCRANPPIESFSKQHVNRR